MQLVMVITISYVLVCVVVFHFNVCIESCNFLKRAHDGSKIVLSMFCKLVYFDVGKIYYNG